MASGSCSSAIARAPQNVYVKTVGRHLARSNCSSRTTCPFKAPNDWSPDGTWIVLHAARIRKRRRTCGSCRRRAATLDPYRPRARARSTAGRCRPTATGSHTSRKTPAGSSCTCSRFRSRGIACRSRSKARRRRGGRATGVTCLTSAPTCTACGAWTSQPGDDVWRRHAEAGRDVCGDHPRDGRDTGPSAVSGDLTRAPRHRVGHHRPELARDPRQEQVAIAACR